MNAAAHTPEPEHHLTGVPVFGPCRGNDDVNPVPRPSRGERTVTYDFPGVEVGTAEYSEGPTGVTVVHVPAGARMSIDARGGAIGLTYGADSFAHAVCLAGGSLYGLGAAPGVAGELLTRVGNDVNWDQLKCVAGAIIYDYSARDNAVTPDAALGRAAMRAARHGEFPVGRCGAGASASVGKVEYSRTEFAGQGAAFRQIGDIRILAATVINAVGVIVDRDGTVLRGNYDAATGTRNLPQLDYAEAFAKDPTSAPTTMPGNTTISVIVTNVRLDDRELAYFGRQVHSSMHRGIQPFHTNLDGDTLFTLTTDEVDLPRNPQRTGQDTMTSVALGAVASEVMWDAILSSVR
ncbi:P1 family peptidase [Streptomyces sp. NPDC058171]